ncbi:MAG: ComEA family DNA-binding protein [Caldilineaceae bacterium]
MALHRTDHSTTHAQAPLTQAPQPAPNPLRTLLHHSMSSLFTLLLAGGLMFYRQRPDPPAIVLHPPPTLAPTATPLPTATPGPITVYVNGAVQRPALYMLAPGSRVGDVILLAGGLLPDANASRINQAEVLSDGDQIYVPPTDAQALTANSASADANTPGTGLTVGALLRSTISSDKLININTATLEELMLLPNIGKTKAENIIAGRPYATIDELERVSGIGPSTVDKLREYVTVD